MIPLTPAVFYILLSLARGERHGYEIMKEVKEDSSGQVKMGTGTLYGSLKRMLDAGLIAEAGERPDPGRADERRRYYRLTDRGQRALNEELQRYAAVVAICAATPPAQDGRMSTDEPKRPSRRAERARRI